LGCWACDSFSFFVKKPRDACSGERAEIPIACRLIAINVPIFNKNYLLIENNKLTVSVMERFAGSRAAATIPCQDSDRAENSTRAGGEE
jgi:hypothetical protein